MKGALHTHQAVIHSLHSHVPSPVIDTLTQVHKEIEAAYSKTEARIRELETEVRDLKAAHKVEIEGLFQMQNSMVFTRFHTFCSEIMLLCEELASTS
jgi:hypothetical protein